MFYGGLSASFASKILPINRNSINAYYNEIRKKILQYSLKEQKKELGEFELDESCLETRWVCRKGEGRGAAGKTPVFWLSKRNGKVFVTVVPNCSKEEPMPIIQGKIPAGSTLRRMVGMPATTSFSTITSTDCRVFRHENEFARGKSHVNAIECFRNCVKRRFVKFNGLSM